MKRRDVVKRGAALALGAIVAAVGLKPNDLEDEQFDDHGYPLRLSATDDGADIVEKVYVNGRDMTEHCTAFDRREGWITWVDPDRDLCEFKMRGNVTVEWKA